MNQSIVVYGYWNDNTTEHFSRVCQIGTTVGDDDDEIFFYFEENEPIIGRHADFTITSYLNDDDEEVTE